MRPEKGIFVVDIGQTITDGGLEYFRKHRCEFDFDDPASLAKVYDAFVPLPDAQVGVSILARRLTFEGYYTIRAPGLQDQAVKWLHRYDFPDPNNVHICSDHTDKVVQIVSDHLLHREGAEAIVVLIDDNLEPLLKAANQLIAERPYLKSATERLILVGFGSKHAEIVQGSLDALTDIHMFSLTSWEGQNVQLLIENIMLTALARSSQSCQ